MERSILNQQLALVSAPDTKLILLIPILLILILLVLILLVQTVLVLSYYPHDLFKSVKLQNGLSSLPHEVLKSIKLQNGANGPAARWCGGVRKGGGGSQLHGCGSPLPPPPRDGSVRPGLSNNNN